MTLCLSLSLSSMLARAIVHPALLHFSFSFGVIENAHRSVRLLSDLPIDPRAFHPRAIIAMIIHAKLNVKHRIKKPSARSLHVGRAGFTRKNWENTCPDARRNGANDVNAILKRSDRKDRVLAISPVNSRATTLASRCNRV